MHYRVLLAALRIRPFKPFDVVMSSGERYRVDHPENMAVAKDAVIIPIYTREPRRDIADDFVYASYLHISALEPVPERRAKSSKR